MCQHIIVRAWRTPHFSSCLKVGRTLMQYSRRSIIGMSATKIQLIGKSAIPIDTSPAHVDTSWTKTAEQTANMKIAVKVEYLTLAIRNLGILHI